VFSAGETFEKAASVNEEDREVKKRKTNVRQLEIARLQSKHLFDIAEKALADYELEVAHAFKAKCEDAAKNRGMPWYADAF